MKSAYELAMERLEKQAPTQKLSERQKAEIADLDTRHRSKVAERELFLRGEIDKARAAGDPTQLGQLEQQLAHDLRRLSDEAEEKKAKVRAQR